MVTRRSVLKGAVSASALALPVTHNRIAAFAQEASPEAVGPPPIPEGSVLLAGGLMGPRFLAIADDGSVYVTESGMGLSLIHISEPTRRTPISYAVFCLKKKKK